MSWEYKRLEFFVRKAWRETKAMDKSVKKIVDKLREVLLRENVILEKRIKNTPYDFLRESWYFKKKYIESIIEDVNYLIERDGVLIRIADLESQINLEKHKEKGDSVSDLIKTLESLITKEKTISSNRKTLVKTFVPRTTTFVGYTVYSRIILMRRVGKVNWGLYNKYSETASDSEEDYKAILQNAFLDAILPDSLPRMFSLNDQNVKLGTMIKYAIRCRSAKVFHIPYGGDTVVLIGAKSRDQALNEAVINYLHLSFADDAEWLEDDSIVGSPIDDDFWENNEDLIRSIKKSLSSRVVEIE